MFEQDFRDGVPGGVSLPAFTDITDTALLRRFESLGPDCEFGFVQRHAGVEPLSLFRFTSAPAGTFLRAAAERFKGVAAPDSIEIFQDSKTPEWFCRIEPYGFVFHTGQYAGASDPDAVKLEQKRRLPFMLRLFLHELESARRIFVRGGNSTFEEVTAICDAIGAYGRGIVLWVTLADERNRPGSVRRHSERLYIGYIERFWTMASTGFNGCLDQWLSICRNVNAMVFDGVTDEVLPRLVRANRPNLLAGRPDWIRLSGQAGAAPASDTRFYLLSADQRFPHSMTASIRVDDLMPDTIYIASLEIWITEAFSGHSVGVLFAGLPSVSFRNADLGMREGWQTVWTTAKCPPSGSLAVAMAIEGHSGDLIFTRNPRLFEGCCL
ncbi:hypothetical protein AruPA_03930 [Acidiphilium sp. PA]|uniref:hypothetical protein n=1 Tax=Acidiphilium sp. PA TaxID=2871705 RepID=UPI002244710F|nr:hypothetical protein [Acidiphilium sp. PA]MCW8306175.1 hypothetical protein [Acidiphilium sp. PA]